MLKQLRLMILWMWVAAVLAELSRTPSSSWHHHHSSPNSAGWSRRRITGVIRSSSLRRIDADPLVSIVSRVVSKSIARRTATTSTASTTQQPLTIPQRLVSGGCSRGIAQALLYPVDALRTLAQTRDGRTLADVGLSALGKGCLTTSSFAVGIGAIQFAIFGATRNSCGPLISAALGAAGSCLVSVPQEVIKQRLVTGVYPSFRSAVATIYSADGVSGFYSGWRPTVARNIPFVVATFLSMDYLTRLRLNHKERTNENAKASLTVAENLAIGVSGALIAGTLTHPVDVIKTRMMTQAASTAVPYKSTVDCVQTVLKTEGWKTFYSGFKQRSLYMGPLWAFQFALNGKFHTAFRRRNSGSTAEPTN